MTKSLALLMVRPPVISYDLKYYNDVYMFLPSRRDEGIAPYAGCAGRPPVRRERSSDRSARFFAGSVSPTRCGHLVLFCMDLPTAQFVFIVLEEAVI